MIVVCKEHGNSRSKPPKDDLSILYLLDSEFLSFASPFAGHFFIVTVVPLYSRSLFFFPNTLFLCLVSQFSLQSLSPWSLLSSFPVLLNQIIGPRLWRYPLVLLYIYIYLILSISHGMHIMLDIWRWVATRITVHRFLPNVAIRCRSAFYFPIIGS